jgi:hypothetical protein
MGPDNFQDFISLPKSNKYQPIHTIVIGPLKQTNRNPNHIKKWMILQNMVLQQIGGTKNITFLISSNE